MENASRMQSVQIRLAEIVEREGDELETDW